MLWCPCAGVYALMFMRWDSGADVYALMCSCAAHLLVALVDVAHAISALVSRLLRHGARVQVPQQLLDAATAWRDSDFENRD